MSSDIYLVDVYANTTKSVIHSCSVIAKTVFTMLLLFFIIFFKSYVKLGIAIILIFSLVLLSRLPFFKILKWSAYALIFGLLFAVSQLFYSYPTAILTVMRVFASSSLMIWFITSTGFIPLFSLVPVKTIKNMLILTYRFFFMIVDNFNRRIKIANLRGVSSAKPITKINSLSNIIAHELIHTIDKAEKVYKIMILRGFDGKMNLSGRFKFSKKDSIMLIYLIGVIALWMI